MRFLISVLLLSSVLFSYQTGDIISKNIQTKLNIKKDKIYIIDFFASWCNSCKKEIPHISKVHQKIDSRKIEIIGIDVDRDINRAQAFQKELKSKNNLTFEVINDTQNNIVKEFNPIGMPALYYLQNRKIVNVTFGAIDDIDKNIFDYLQRLQK